MKLAYCTLSDEEYEASEFAEQGADWISQHRLHLECKVCHGQAFFRRAAVSGQAACFGARPHLPGCHLATLSSDQNERTDKIEKDVLSNPGRQFLLRLPSLKAHKGPGSGTHNLRRTHDVIGAKFTNWRKSLETSSSISAKECLINLVLSEKYRQSEQLIRAPRGATMKIKDFFVPFKEAHGFVDSTHGFWGTFFDYRDGNNLRWLNSGGKQNMTVLLENSTEADLLANYGLQNVEQIIGAHVLVLGEVRASKASGKLILKPKNAKHIVLYIPDDIGD